MNETHGLNLHLLRLFAAVVEKRSFTRAAESQCVSQSAISHAVRALEQQTGLALIDRSGGPRHWQPTEAGAALHAHARALFALERTALEDLRQRLGQARGHLRLAASTTIAGYWLPPLLARFHRHRPALDLSLRVGNTREVARIVQAGDVDLGYVEGMPDAAMIDIAHWRDEALRVVAPPCEAPGNTLPAATTWLLREPGSGTRQVALAFLADHGIVPARTLEMGSNEAIARAVAAGLGLALLPRVITDELERAGRLRGVEHIGETPAPTRPLYRLQLPGRPLSPAMAAWLELDSRSATSPRHT